MAAIPDTDCYVLLDGANLSMALVAMGVPHVVAQVHNPEIIVDSWYHIVSGLDIQEFEAALVQIAGLRLEECSLSDRLRNHS